LRGIVADKSACARSIGTYGVADVGYETSSCMLACKLLLK
jgi:hypothetical protein